MPSTTAAAGQRESTRTGASEHSPARRRPGRPRDAHLDAAILTTAEHQLRVRGYADMTLESVAAGAGTTVPTLRRRYRSKAALAVAVVDSLRIKPLQTRTGATPRARALAVLEDLRRNLEREHSMALLGTLLVEEGRNPQLLERFRSRLVKTRRSLLADALQAGIAAGDLPPDTDVDTSVNLLIGSFYARYIGQGRIPQDWTRRAMRQIWPTTSDGAEARAAATVA